MKISLQNIDFTGPLDLLLELIKKNRYEIKDIFIIDIINQYLEVVEKMTSSQLDMASEFIVMAASLMEIKSRYLIFLNDDDAEDPGRELIDILETYKYYKDRADIMKDMYENTPCFYTNKGYEIFTEKYLDLSRYTVKDVYRSYTGINRQLQESRSQIISFKKISVDDKIREIQEILEKHANIYFEKILNTNEKDEVVASFLGVLELAKDQKVDIHQKRVFEEILIERLYSL